MTARHCAALRQSLRTFQRPSICAFKSFGNELRPLIAPFCLLREELTLADE